MLSLNGTNDWNRRRKIAKIIPNKCECHSNLLSNMRTEKSPENKACDQDRMPISAFHTKIYFELLLRYFRIYWMWKSMFGYFRNDILYVECVNQSISHFAFNPSQYDGYKTKPISQYSSIEINYEH